MDEWLRANGFDVEDLIEIRPPEDSRRFMEKDLDLPSLEWSRRWPCEEIWKASKKAPRGAVVGSQSSDSSED